MPPTRSHPDPHLSPEVVWYLDSRGYEIPPADRAPLVHTPEPRDVAGATFLPDKVDAAIAALRCLTHTKGKWAGRPLAPAPWQVAYIIAPVWGWNVLDDPDPDTGKQNHVRIIRSVFIEVPRKNGKTTLTAGLSMVLAFADHEPGAEVLLGAGSRDQARVAFTPLTQVARGSAVLQEAGVRPYVGEIRQPATNSTIKVVSSRAELSHGAHVHGGLVDELWAHKSPDLLEAIESGTGARAQPLVFIITMADENSTTSVYAQRRRMIEQLSEHLITLPSMYGVVFGASEGDDIAAESTWRRANPNYPVTPTRSFMAAELAKAQANPVNLASFKRLHLGIRTSLANRWVDLDRWRRNASIVDPKQLVGRRAFGGLDLASVSDLTALCWLFPGAYGYDVRWHFWLPEAALRALDDTTQRMASTWVASKHIVLTPGDVTDYEWISTQIRADLSAYRVSGIGFDRWNSSQLVVDLEKEGAPMVRVGQGYASLSAPSKELERLYKLGTPERPMIRHGGNPVVLWMADNLRMTKDAAGNLKPDKDASPDKIDGFSALITALSLAMEAKPERTSAYSDEKGLTSV